MDVDAEVLRDGRLLVVGKAGYVLPCQLQRVGIADLRIHAKARQRRAQEVHIKARIVGNHDGSAVRRIAEKVHQRAVDLILRGGGFDHLVGDLGDGNRGSKIYADFIGLTSVFGSPIATVGDVIGLVDKGAFDFSKTEDDNRILAYLEQNDGDVKKTEEQLRKEWGEEFDQYAEQYQIEDVFEGIYHGKGEDYSDEIRAYAKKMAASGDLKGCVAVDERLGELLQMLMDKFTFEDVENSWIKVCYYYNNIGK